MAEVQIPSAPTADDPAHVAAMVAKAENPNAAPQVAPTDGKPDDGFAGLGSQEALVKAYIELRTKMSADGAPKADDAKAAEEAAAAEAAKAAEATPSADEAAKAAEKAGVDMAALEAEFAEKGELTAETYESLQKAGFDKTTVDAYIAGQQAIQEQLQGRIEAHVGGAEKLSATLEWAKDNLSEAEITAFNNVVDTADEAGLKLALDGLVAKRSAAEGSEPKLIGGKPPANAGAVFRSTAELTAAMRDPRYNSDPAYRADVEAKLQRSSLF